MLGNQLSMAPSYGDLCHIAGVHMHTAYLSSRTLDGEVDAKARSLATNSPVNGYQGYNVAHHVVTPRKLVKC